MKTSSSYHTQHSPLGAFASFTIGRHGARGGFGQSLGGPANQNIYVGFRRAPAEAWRLLPFFVPEKQSAEAAFTGEIAEKSDHEVEAHAAMDGADFERTLGWASDSWRCDEFRFSLWTPWRKTDDPASMGREEARLAFAPLVCGCLEYDNTASDSPAELVFGLRDNSAPWRPLGDSGDKLAGFANGTACGYATQPAKEVRLRQAFNIFAPRFRDERGLHLLGSENALIFRVPPRVRRRYPLVLAFFQAGQITTGIKSAFFHSLHFRDLEDVLAHGLTHHAKYAGLARRRDQELARAKLNDAQRWLIAQSTHSYLGSTQLLHSRGQPLWAVNEGEYRMLNTFDLTVDHLFFELTWHPWAIRRVLDLFVTRYAYQDQIHSADGRRANGGISFVHDMGACNQFTPAGRSSYECRDLHGCFSHMTMEQLVNWVCCAVTYAVKTRDLAWLRRRRNVLLACAESLRRRDDPDPQRRNGLLKWDSDRCGPKGGEITTYDSLDASLGQARNNLYLAGKTLAAWLLLERAFGQLDLTTEARRSAASADLLVTSLSAKFEDDTGFFPAVFEAGNRSRILPAVEGLVFPLYLGFSRQIGRRYPELFKRLERHLAQALQTGVCLDARSGAWKISSTSHNTWFSKIALAQHVVRKLFPAALNPRASSADAVHQAMQQGEWLGSYAMVDQFHSTTGRDIGSRYYPRGVTACLWLTE